jgi:catechol 2,3-dioxygenase-like lactoylglutathione lyase family enzyme
LVGTTVLAPFPEATDYFGRAEQVWMINFRVENLDRMVAQLGAAGIIVVVDPTPFPNGHFARTHDPEGNPIELGTGLGIDLTPEKRSPSARRRGDYRAVPSDGY